MEMHDKSYSLEDIKNAYWKVFHGSGEHFFHYDNDEKANDSTEQGWKEFYQTLERVKNAD